MKIDEAKLSKIENIIVSGLGDIENTIVLNDIKKLPLENIFFINSNKLISIINSNSLVEEFQIFKKYPSALDIKLKKTEFLAKIKKNGKIQIIGSNGKLLSNIQFNKELPFIFGSPNIEEFLFFKSVIDQSNFSYNDIKNLYFFPSKRWDLQLKNDVIIKLSQKDIELSLNNAYYFLKNENFIHTKIIDARFEKKIILND